MTITLTDAELYLLKNVLRAEKHRIDDLPNQGELLKTVSTLNSLLEKLGSEETPTEAKPV